MEETKIQCVPPQKFERNEYGLLTHINYIFNEDTRKINWRKMVKPEYLVPNKERTKETDVSKLEDKDLLILLGGLKELAQLRGYTSISPHVVVAHPEFVTCECHINWIPNFETEGRSIISGGVAMATFSNTESFTKNYLAEMAENRAFARCIRSFLNINIVSKEEVGTKNGDSATEEFSPSDPKTTLQQLMSKKQISFEKLKAKLIKDNIPEAASFTCIGDIPKTLVFDIIDKIQATSNKK